MFKPTSLSEQLMYSTLTIQTDTGSGTGFVFNEYYNEKQFFPLLITNKHVIEGASKASIRFHKNLGDGFASEGIIELEIDNFQSRWTLHPDPEVDLCSMSLAPEIKRAIEDGQEIFFRSFSRTSIPSDDQLSNLTAVEQVTMIGYPIGLTDLVNNFPLMRRGITANHPMVDFGGKPIGVVDIACFPGSSGSPIVILNEGIYTDKFGNNFTGSRQILLGALFAGPVMKASGRLEIETIPTSQVQVPKTDVMIHLGYYVKAREIITLANHFRSKMGLPQLHGMGSAWTPPVPVTAPPVASSVAAEVGEDQ